MQTVEPSAALMEFGPYHLLALDTGHVCIIDRKRGMVVSYQQADQDGFSLWRLIRDDDLRHKLLEIEGREVIAFWHVADGFGWLCDVRDADRSRWATMPEQNARS